MFVAGGFECVTHFVISVSFRVLKLKEVESNTDQTEISEDFLIVANREENCVSLTGISDV